MSTNKRRALAAGAAVCFAVAMIFAANPASAVHDDGIFELEGNAIDAPAVAGDDWSTIYANRADDCAALAATANTVEACSFTTDAPNGTIFTTGGSKDEQEV